MYILLALFFKQKTLISDTATKRKSHVVLFYRISSSKFFFLYFCTPSTYFIMYIFLTVGHVYVFFLLNTDGMNIMYIKD